MKFKQILSKFCVSQNLHNAVSQQPYVGVEEEKGGGVGSGGGFWSIPPCAPFPLKQIVPTGISASIYTVFHSGIYNSVDAGQYRCMADQTNERMDAGQVRCRTGRMHDRMYAGQIRYRT